MNDEQAGEDPKVHRIIDGGEEVRLKLVGRKLFGLPVVSHPSAPPGSLSVLTHPDNPSPALLRLLEQRDEVLGLRLLQLEEVLREFLAEVQPLYANGRIPAEAWFRARAALGEG